MSLSALVSLHFSGLGCVRAWCQAGVGVEGRMLWRSVTLVDQITAVVHHFERHGSLLLWWRRRRRSRDRQAEFRVADVLRMVERKPAKKLVVV